MANKVRTLNDKVVLAIRVDPALRKRVVDYCEEHSCTLTMLVEKAIELGIEEAEAQLTEGLIRKAKEQLAKLQPEASAG